MSREGADRAHGATIRGKGMVPGRGTRKCRGPEVRTSLSASPFVSEGCLDQYHRHGSLTQQKCLLSQSWRPEVRIKVSPGLVPSGGSEGESVPRPSPRCWWLSAILAFPVLKMHPSRICLHLHMAFSSHCVLSPFPSLRRILYAGFRERQWWP